MIFRQRTSHSTGYLRGPTTFTIDPSPFQDSAGKVVILGDLQVDGTQTILNSTAITISDKNIVLADSASNASEANGAGITVNGANATITYNSATDRWVFNKDIDGTLVGAYTTSDFNTDFATKSTSDLSEGTNLYYTTVRPDSDFDVCLATKSTTNITEGTNLYYTTARSDSDFDVRLATKTTTNLTEGTNLYYTDTRANTAIDARVDQSFVQALNIAPSRAIVGAIDANASYNLIMTATIGSADSVVADGELTYNPNTDTLTTQNVEVDNDLTVTGRLLDGSGRVLQILDSDGSVLWG